MCLWRDADKLSCLVGGLHTFVSCNNDADLVFPEIFKC